MSTAEREEFLAGLHVGILSIERPDGPPLASPIWYRYAPGGAIEFNTEAASAKGRLLQSAGRATLCVVREAVPYRYVTVDGPVEIGPTSMEARLGLAVRYLGDEGGRSFVEQTKDVDDVLVRLTPELWFSADYGKLDG